MDSEKCESFKRTLSLVMGFIECFLFGATVVSGWPALVFVLKQEGVYSDLCDVNSSDVVTAVYPVEGTNHNVFIPTIMSTAPLVMNNNLTIVDNLTVLGRYVYGWSGVDESSNSTALLPIDAVDGSNTVPEDVTSEPVSCPARDRMFSLAYTIGMSFRMVMNIVQGKIFDAFGMRVLRIIASLMFIPGGFFLAFASEDNPWMIFPGTLLMAMAGSSIIITNTHLSLLAGSKKSTVATLYSGGVDCSICVFLVVKLLWENGVSSKVSLCVVTALWSIVIFDTFVLFPKDKATLPHRNGTVKQTRISLPHAVPSLKLCVTSSIYYLHVLWFSILFLRLCCFFNFFNVWINDITDNHTEKVSVMTNVFGILLFCGILISPLLGLAMDWCKNRIFAPESSLAGNALAAMPVLFFGSIMAILVSVTVLVPIEYFVYISFVFFVVFKTCAFGLFYAYFNLAIPQKHYGLLLGIGTACAGIVSALQYPLLIWAERSPRGFLPVNVLLLVLSVCCLIHPINLCVRNRRRKKPRIIRPNPQHIAETKLLE